jgi:Cof subfamily protein (haloacid dehalogenase superfamily)
LIRLIGIDVDGTLVGASGVVAPRIWEAAARARAADIHLVLCSGRPAFGVAVEYARNLNPNGWHVFQNGASIVHFATGESLSTSIPELAVNQLIEQSRQTNWVLELYSDSRYATESTSAWAREHAELLGIPFSPSSFDELRAPIVRAQWLASTADAPLAMQSAPANLEIAESTSPLMPNTRFIGMTARGVSKGAAMKIVAAKYGIVLEETMYVGDAHNDLSALCVVGTPVAMANADDAVKAASRHIVGHVDQAGLADALGLAIEGRLEGSGSKAAISNGDPRL